MESFTQCVEYNFKIGANISANHLASSCWEELIFDKIGLIGIFLYVLWASHTYAVILSFWVEPYHKYHEPGCFGLLSLRDVFAPFSSFRDHFSTSYP